MEKTINLSRIFEKGLIAVVRAPSLEKAMLLAEALKEGGIDIIEITLTVPGALEVIRALRGQYASHELLVGAGTVLDTETARMAILAGAEFIVSPGLDEGVVRMCHRYQKVSMPGAMTVTEVLKAMEAGGDIIKMFPGEVIGPKGVKAIRGPLPYAPLMPTGGVSLETIPDWFAAGVVGVGVGSELTRQALATGDYSSTVEMAKQFSAKVKESRGI
jgi:2-dehydro-3-deoxyphosphogluconate aldolase/(4S)-4-hydroxy-2-oxoglutarate aldolase